MAQRIIELHQFSHEAGHCWTASLTDELEPGDRPGRNQSTLVLFEDGRSLGPAHSAHEAVRSQGHGRYSHWGNQIWFSTSDNSLPISNGRRYVVVVRTVGDEDVDNLTTLPTAVGSQLPVNFHALSSCPETLDRDANYAVTVARSYIDSLPRGRRGLEGKSLLELGPGTNLGPLLVLLCWGADKAAAADRFLVPFDPNHHVPLYRKIAEILLKDNPATDVRPIEDCITARGHQTKQLFTFKLATEELDAVDMRFDITASNAVFEHLYCPLDAARALHQITKTGGMGVHQVDFRDHRTFDTPLEFLLEDERSFDATFQRHHGEMGNRVRPHQLSEIFRLAGFTEIRLDVNMLADSAYLDGFLPRLRQAQASPYSALTREQLQPIGGRFVVRR